MGPLRWARCHAGANGILTEPHPWPPKSSPPPLSCSVPRDGASTGGRGVPCPHTMTAASACEPGSRSAGPTGKNSSRDAANIIQWLKVISTFREACDEIRGQLECPGAAPSDEQE